MKYLQGCVLFVSFSCIWAGPLTITIGQGTLSGSKLKSRNGTEYRSFLGIPYAKPPVGQLRFQPPQEPDNWNGTRSATSFPPVCVQKDIFSSNASFGAVEGQEDCLYLNVYTPLNVTSSSKLPVLVHIHGGGFISDSANFFSPEYFMDYNVILVFPNYRLGPFGFISTADSVIPGNYGMKDQVAALKWVKKNIAVFGGDPELVTILGDSSGAVAVNFHMYSPLSKGLFHRAISHSGSALALWARSRPSIIRQKTLAFGILVGCPVDSSAELLECLQSVPANDLMLAHNKLYVWDFHPKIHFSIVPESESVEDAFIYEDPWMRLPVNNVPWITGITSGEGAVLVARYLSDNGHVLEEINMNYKRLFPLMTCTAYWYNFSESTQMAEAIKQFYFKNEEIGNGTAKNFMNMVTDYLFFYPCFKAMSQNQQPVFFYYFDHRNAISFSSYFGNTSCDLGVAHCDDLLSFFSFKFSGFRITEGPDFNVSVRLIERWINFARFGNPSVGDKAWDPFDADEINYLHITSSKDEMKKGLLRDRLSFWKNILSGLDQKKTDTRRSEL